MSEMLERVAEAIWLESVADDEDYDSFGEFEFLRAREKFRNLARAALKAMVEPTDEMKRPAMEAFVLVREPVVTSERSLSREKMAEDPEQAAFCAGVSSGYGSGNAKELLEVWRAMVRAALKEEPDA